MKDVSRVALMAKLGLKNYRFSIAWPRLLPNGTLSGGINQKGVAFYHQLIDELRAHGIEPFVTLFHWDLPDALQTPTLRGWLDRAIVPLFRAFAELCFREYAGKVKYWTTFNEAWTFTVLGYGTGSKAPGEPYTDIGRYPYLAGHNVLLAHAEAVEAFRANEDVARLGGRIGITNNCDWNEPASSAPEDISAAERANEFWLAWFADPIWLGHYPASMVRKLGSRLPTFTAAESAKLKGSADFFGLNHYGSQFASASPTPDDYDQPGGTSPMYWADYEARQFHTESMPRAASVWLYSVPWGLRKLLNWVDRRYSPALGGGRLPIYVTENGWSTPGDEPWREGVVDDGRVLYYANYTGEVQRAINEDGVNVKGYFAWSLMDNFEWERGFSERFGLVYTDFETQERHIKMSARWYQATMADNAVADPCPYLNPASETSFHLGCHCTSPTQSAAAAAASTGHAASVLPIAIVGILGVVGVTGLAWYRRRLADPSLPGGATERMVEPAEEGDGL